jgi:hypothetical protein
MARRGTLTALQAALAGIGGAAGGYVQQEELKRKRLEEERQREREEARDLILYGREAITPGPLATRAPTALPKMEMPAGAPPSAIPMPTGPVDFAGASRQLEQEEAVPSGTQAIKIGNQTLYVPVGQRYRDIKRSEALQADTDAIQRATDVAKAQGDVQRQLDAAKNFGYYKIYSKQYGKKEAYDPETPYKELIDLEEGARGRASAERSAAARSSVFGQQNIGAGVDYSKDVDAVSQYLPTEREEGGKKQTVAPAKRLDSTKLLLVKRLQEGSDAAYAALAAAQAAGQDFTNELAYYTTASGIASAYAIQEQRGRNVSDLDIKNRIRQITVQPEEAGNPQIEMLKANRLRQWAQALNNPAAIPQVQAGRTTAPPALGNMRRITQSGAGTSVMRPGTPPFNVDDF